jgi:hypothetical protein
MSDIDLNDKNNGIDITWIKYNIQLILDKTHTHPTKRIIKQKHDRLSFACPICGDSHKDNSAKRGHLFLNNLYYNIYNEDCRSNFTKLCKLYDVQLDVDKKLALINWVDTNTKLYSKSQDDILFNQFDKAISLNDLKEWFESGLGPLKGFQQIKWGSQAYIYLKERGFNDSQMSLIYEGIKVNGKWSEPFIVFLNIANDKVLGMQERNLQKGIKRKFKIWTFSELYRSIYQEQLDQLEEIGYNKVSQLFNLFSVNYEKTITIFEAYLDSLFWPNSIGAVGMNTDINFLLHNELDLQLFYDNDNPGRRKAKEMLLLGHKVFLWDKYIEDYSNQSNDYYTNKKWFNNNIKDLNDIIVKIKLTSYKELLPYFSNQLTDLYYITNDEKIKKKYIKENIIQNIHNIDWIEQINTLNIK